jgi:hypothetical protein
VSEKACKEDLKAVDTSTAEAELLDSPIEDFSLSPLEKSSKEPIDEEKIKTLKKATSLSRVDPKAKPNDLFIRISLVEICYSKQ